MNADTLKFQAQVSSIAKMYFALIAKNKERQAHPYVFSANDKKTRVRYQWYNAHYVTDTKSKLCTVSFERMRQRLDSEFTEV